MIIGIPYWLGLLFSVIGGLVIGSFANVVIARLPNKESVVRPGSRCPKCRAPVRWFDNIPLFSYVILRGRCRSCGNRIDFRYPVVEAVTGALFAAAYWKLGAAWELPLRIWPWIAILVMITFIDLSHRIIPDWLNLAGLVVGLATGWAVPELGWTGSFAGAGMGFSVFFFFSWIYTRFTGRQGLGGGDVKLLAMLGAFIGPLGVFYCILISSVTGSVIGIAWAVSAGKKNVMKAALPFGPFLVLGALVYYFLGEKIIWLITPTMT